MTQTTVTFESTTHTSVHSAGWDKTEFTHKVTIHHPELRTRTKYMVLTPEAMNRFTEQVTTSTVQQLMDRLSMKAKA